MIKRIISHFFSQKVTPEENTEPLDGKKILEDCNDARLLLCRRMIDSAKTAEDRTHAKQLLAETMKDRALIPITVAKRTLYFAKE